MCIEHKKNIIAELKEKLKQAEEKAELEQEEGIRATSTVARLVKQGLWLRQTRCSLTGS